MSSESTPNDAEPPQDLQQKSQGQRGKANNEPKTRGRPTWAKESYLTFLEEYQATWLAAGKEGRSAVYDKVVQDWINQFGLVRAY